MKFLTLIGKFVSAEMLSTWSGGPTFEVSYNAEKEKLQIDTTVPENMWLGISYKYSMNSADSVIFQGQNDGDVKDLWSTGYGMPSTDDSQDYEVVSSALKDGVYTIQVLRALDTGDSSQDMVIQCG